MRELARKRCLNHEMREAVSRCPSCRDFFCRECVILFESRLLCGACLAQISSERPLESRRSESKARLGFGGFALAVAGLLIAWMLFYLAGWAILELREHAPLARAPTLAARRAA